MRLELALSPRLRYISPHMNQPKRPGIKTQTPVTTGLPAVTCTLRYDLDELLQDYRPEHHQPEPDWGPDVGNEVIPE